LVLGRMGSKKMAGYERWTEDDILVQ